MPVDEYDLASLKDQEQAAAFLGVSPRTLRRLVADKELAVVRIGSGRGRPMFTTRALLDYANRHHTQADPGPRP